MLPSLAPAAADFAAAVRREPSRVLLFAARLSARLERRGHRRLRRFELGRSLFGGSLAWHSGGRWLAAGVLVARRALPADAAQARVPVEVPQPESSCRRQVAGHAARGASAGLRNGGWCLGCTWALMAALFALGVMSLIWMGLIAVLVALEKVGPWGAARGWRRPASWSCSRPRSWPCRTRSRGSSFPAHRGRRR